jgi:hypothetical protein
MKQKRGIPVTVNTDKWLGTCPHKVTGRRSAPIYEDDVNMTGPYVASLVWDECMCGARLNEQRIT